MAEADGKKEALSFYEEEVHLTKLCNFLRSNQGPPVREAVEMDKRVYYLKGTLFRATAYTLQLSEKGMCCDWFFYQFHSGVLLN